MPIFVELTKRRSDGSLARILLETKIIASTVEDLDEAEELLSMAELHVSLGGISVRIGDR